jgi:hypothetical protein
MARLQGRARVDQLRAEGKGTWEISRTLKREKLEDAILDIRDIADVKSVLEQMLKEMVIH